MSAAVAENFQRPNITVAAGTGIGVLMVAPVESCQDTGETVDGHRRVPDAANHAAGPLAASERPGQAVRLPSASR